MGFLKKFKAVAEKGLEKGVEFGTKGYDAALDNMQRRYEYSHGNRPQNINKSSETPAEIKEITTNENKKNNDMGNLSASTKEAIQALKLRLVKGEISKEEFEEMKTILIESD